TASSKINTLSLHDALPIYAQRSKFLTTASALKSVPSWNVTPSSNSNVYGKPSSDTSQSCARPGSISVPPSSNSTIVSKMFFVTVKVSHSVVRDVSKDVDSLPLPKRSVPPPPDSFAFTSSSSFPPASLSPPEHAASIVPRVSNNNINKNFVCFTFM